MVVEDSVQFRLAVLAVKSIRSAVADYALFQEYLFVQSVANLPCTHSLVIVRSMLASVDHPAFTASET